MPLPFLLAAGAEAGTTALGGMFAKRAVSAAAGSTSRGVIKRAAGRIAAKSSKPNKLLQAPRVAKRSIVPYVPPQRINVPSRPRPESKPEHAGNRQPYDDSVIADYKQPSSPSKQQRKSPDTSNETPTKEREGAVDTTARLLAASQIVNDKISSFIPSITWTGSVSATGFKTTPLRTVLHYCLAVVFGLVHQSRIGNTTIKVDLFPIDNRVEVSFVNASSLLLEILNVAGTSLLVSAQDSNSSSKGGSIGAGIVAGATGGIVGGDLITRQIGSSGTVIGTIKEILNFDISQFVKDLVKRLGDVNRAIGPAGIWDMAQSNIYAGRPPGSMAIGNISPFMLMYSESVTGKTPMLTRQMAANPQAPVVPNMHFPTHFDLRSLVAQALYDPGVLPPTPDTNVALPTITPQNV